MSSVLIKYYSRREDISRLYFQDDGILKNWYPHASTSHCRSPPWLPRPEDATCHHKPGAGHERTGHERRGWFSSETFAAQMMGDAASCRRLCFWIALAWVSSVCAGGRPAPEL